MSRKLALLKIPFYGVGLFLLARLSEHFDNTVGESIFVILWLALAGFIVVHEFIWPRMKLSKHSYDRSQIDKELSVFFDYQESLIRDPETIPTHSYDPEFGYMELDNQSNVENESCDLDENEVDQESYSDPISNEVLAKLESEDELSKAEYLALINYSDAPSSLYKRLSDEDQNDREVVLAGLANMGTFLRFTPEQFRDDEEVVARAVENGRNAFDFASTRLRSDKKRWMKVWPELEDFLFSDNYPDLRSSRECSLFSKRMFDVIEKDGFRMSSMGAGDSIGFFGRGLVQAICHYKHEYVLTDGERETFNRERDSGKTVYIERMVRIYFKFITNGDFDDQPFIRITEKYENYDPDSSHQFFEAIDYRWYDNYTKSAYPTTHDIFFARLCFDIKDSLNQTDVVKPSQAWGS